jgi:hypothetical protein
MASTFGAAPDRWYDQPLASAISLYSSYRMAFQGCADYVGSDPAYAAAPTTDSATSACTQMATKFWSRIPSSDEVAACVNVALNAASDASIQERWQHICASVLTSAGFLNY